MITVTVNVKWRDSALHFALAMHTLHNLNPYAKIIRPILRGGQVGRDEHQVFVFRRTHNVKGRLTSAKPEHQTTVAAHIFRVIFKHFAGVNDLPDFRGGNQSLWARHLPNRVGQKQYPLRGSRSHQSHHFRFVIHAPTLARLAQSHNKAFVRWVHAASSDEPRKI